MDVTATKAAFRQKAARVLYLVEEKRAALGSPGADQWQALSLARFHMLRALNEFVLFKEDKLLLPVMVEAPGEPASTARRLNDRNLDLQRDYDAFVQRWLLQGALSVSPEYRAEAETMMARIERQVETDAAAVEALLDHVAANDRNSARPA